MTAIETNMLDLLAQQGLSAAYPDSWDGFIGQPKAKRQLQVAAQSAKMRGHSMPHTLLASGEAGIGKTTLALLTAAELGTAVQIVSGRMTVNEARITLSGLEDGDVLFIDELHQLVSRGKASAEWLLHLLQDGVLMGPLGPEEQPDVTVIGATTDAGKLPETLLSRFQIAPVLEPYTDEDAGLITVVMAEKILLKPLPFVCAEDARAIAKAGSNNPRTIGMILSNLRDLALVDPSVHDGSRFDLTEALEWMGLAYDGLSAKALEYLDAMLTEFGGQAGEKALMARLNEPGGIAHIERQLLDRGYIARTRSGRLLTKEGIRRARQEQGHEG